MIRPGMRMRRRGCVWAAASENPSRGVSKLGSALRNRKCLKVTPKLKLRLLPTPSPSHYIFDSEKIKWLGRLHKSPAPNFPAV